MVEMGIFNALALFSYSHFLFCEAQQSFAAHQNYSIFFDFTYCDG